MNEFDDLDDFEDVFGPLRSPARPAELSQESATVDLMVNAHRTSEGKHMLTSRRARIATLVAAGVLGFGGMAAATPNLLGEEPVDEPTVVVEDEQPVEDVPTEDVPVEETPLEESPVEETPVEETPVEETPVAEVPVEETPVAEVPLDVVPLDVVPLVDDPATAFDERYCVPGNHGKTVSAVARGKYTLGESPQSVTVTEAAQSSCGKAREADGDDPEIESEVEVEVESEVESEGEVEVEVEKSEAKAERPGKSDNGNGKSNGKSGNGKSGNGNGKRGG